MSDDNTNSILHRIQRLSVSAPDTPGYQDEFIEVLEKFDDVQRGDLDANIQALRLLWRDDALRGACEQVLEDYWECLGEDLAKKCDKQQMLTILGMLFATRSK